MPHSRREVRYESRDLSHYGEGVKGVRAHETKTWGVSVSRVLTFTQRPICLPRLAHPPLHEPCGTQRQWLGRTSHAARGYGLGSRASLPRHAGGDERKVRGLFWKHLELHVRRSRTGLQLSHHRRKAAVLIGDIYMSWFFNHKQLCLGGCRSLGPVESPLRDV